MKARFLAIMIVCACLAAAAGFSAFAQGQHPGGPPPGGAPPGGVPPGGFPTSGQPPSGPPPNGSGPGGHAAPSRSANDSHRSSNANHSSIQFGPVGRWWDNRSVVQSVGIQREQQRKMDSIFDANKSAILASYKTFLSEQAKLNALNKNPNVDQTQLFTAIDSVNQARAALQKATAQMLLQIRQEMKPDQIEKLEKLQ
jgi:Spy/CpxP family protein refolding chaperone